MPKKDPPQPPIGPIAALVQGFEVVSAQPVLILPPLLLDLFLWLGPRLSVRTLAARLDTNNLSLGPWMDVAGLQKAFETLNLFAALSTTPLGVPSLLSIRWALTPQTPLGPALIWDLSSGLVISGVGLLLMLGGLWLGALYMGSIALQVRETRLPLGTWLREVWGQWVQLGLLALVLLGLLLLLGLPLAIVTMVAFIFGPFVGVVVLLTGTTCLTWVFFYALYAPHSILLQRHNVFQALWESAQLVQVSLPTTATLVLLVIVISQGLDWLWNIPEDSSWMLLVGIGGHALVSTALLAATFVFYQDQHRWWTEVRAAQLAAKPTRSNNS